MNAPTIAAAHMSGSRLFNAYAAETKCAFLRFLRNPAFVIPTLAFPVFFFFLVGFVFGAFKAKSSVVDIPLYVFCGFATMAAMTPGMFGFGIGFAMEREQGLLTLKRALPMPPLASLVGSINMSILSTLMATTILAIAASASGIISLSVDKLSAVVLISALGAVPFCAMGLLIGSFTSGRAAPAVVNVIYLLFTYFSGLFIQLPKAIDWVVAGSPAFYLHQLTLAAVGTKNFMIGGIGSHIAMLLGVTMLCLGISARRLARTG